jgi:hypothetical protein
MIFITRGVWKDTILDHDGIITKEDVTAIFPSDVGYFLLRHHRYHHSDR